MTPAEAADRELALVVAKLRAWAQDPPPAMQGLAPAAAFAFAATVLGRHDHRREGAPEDVQAIERRLDLLTWIRDATPYGILTDEEHPERVSADLAALERSGLIVADGSTWKVPRSVNEAAYEAGLRALVSQVEP